MSAFTKSSILVLFVILPLFASGCTGPQGDGGSSQENGTESGSGSLPFTSEGPPIRTVAEVASELEAGDGNMVPLFESEPNLLAEYIGQDTKKLATLNEQLKKTHNERTKIGKGQPDEQPVESSSNEETRFQLGDLIPMADEDFPVLNDLLNDNTWVEKPVVDSTRLMMKRQESEKSLATVQEALKLTNESSDLNLKIRSAMGRLAANSQEINFDATWYRHTSGDVKSTNPIMISSSAEFDVSGLTSFGLMGFDWTFTPFASNDTVVSWQSSENGLLDKVVMRDDVYWSDGTRITAHDVEFSYRVIMSSKVPVPAVRSGTDQLQGVKAYDDQTIVYFHPAPLATNVWNINFPVLPKHIYEKSIADDPSLAASEYHVSMDENPVTGGPYVITKRTRGQEIVLERRDSYHTVDGKQVRDIPHFKNIRFAIIEDPSTALLSMKKGDIEEMQLTPEQWKEQTNDEEFYGRNTKVYDIEWVYFYFGWNTRSPFFRDARVRRAMSLTFNHAEMMERHRKGMDEQSQGIFHRTSPWAPKELPPAFQQNLDAAEDLLQSAGWEDTNGDGILDGMVFLDNEFDGQLEGVRRSKFEFTIAVSNRSDRIALCELLRENLDQIGIICNVRPVEFTVLQQMARDHKFHAQFAGWGTGTDPDTSENLWTTKAIDSGRNYVAYSNAEIDQLFQDGKYELDPEKRRRIYQDIHLKLYEDQPYTWLFYRNAYFAFSKSLRGYNFSPRGPYSYGPGEGTIFKSPTLE
ncbi:MAG: ABC transporter substrate-binding protein [Fuerstiella sp.]|nr:ABC transporter substrate-binding protein [Fuerstiella sp.]